MIRYFKINDPYRLLVLLVFLSVGRLPWLLGDPGPTLPELDWLVAGERLSTGSLLYAELWDELGPLSALVYSAIDFVFGRSVLSYRIAGLILYFFQTGYFNHFLRKRKAFSEYTYVPAFIYALLGMMFFDTITLSPQLMALTALLGSIDSSFGIIASREQPRNLVLNTGLLLATAALFYLPIIVFAIPILTGLLLYSNLRAKGFFLLFYGILAPFLLLWLYYYWRGETTALQISYFHSLFRGSERTLLSLTAASAGLALPAITTVFSVAKVLRHPGFINYQVCLQWIIILLGIAALFIWLLWSDRSGSASVIFVAPMAFFMAQFFQILKKAWIREGLAVLIILFIAYMNFGPRKGPASRLPDYTKSLIAVPKEYPALPSGTKVLVIGDDRSYYLHHRLATPYFKWRLSKQQLERLDYYDNLVDIFLNFRADMPGVIIDQHSIMPEIFSKIPSLREAYRQGADNGVYYLK